MSRGRKSSDDEAVMGCILYLLLGVIFMPIVGVYFILGNNPDRKALGWFLLIGGILLWIVVGLAGG